MKPTWFCVQNTAADVTREAGSRPEVFLKNMQQLKFTVMHKIETQSRTAVTGLTLQLPARQSCEQDVTRLVHDL